MDIGDYNPTVGLSLSTKYNINSTVLGISPMMLSPNYKY
jgi:hypothetical protein